MIGSVGASPPNFAARVLPLARGSQSKTDTASRTEPVRISHIFSFANLATISSWPDYQNLLNPVSWFTGFRFSVYKIFVPNSRFTEFRFFLLENYFINSGSFFFFSAKCFPSPSLPAFSHPLQQTHTPTSHATTHITQAHHTIVCAVLCMSKCRNSNMRKRRQPRLSQGSQMRRHQRIGAH